MKKLRIQKHTRTDFLTYLGVIAAFAVLSTLNASGVRPVPVRSAGPHLLLYVHGGVAEPDRRYLGGAESGPRGIHERGCFLRHYRRHEPAERHSSEPIRLAIAMVVGALVAALAGVIVGTPVLRLRATTWPLSHWPLAKSSRSWSTVFWWATTPGGCTSPSTSPAVRASRTFIWRRTAFAIIKGCSGCRRHQYHCNLHRRLSAGDGDIGGGFKSETQPSGQGCYGAGDNSIAAESIGLNITKYKMMAFVTSAALAGAAGGLYGLNFSSLQATKFNFNTSILILVFVVLGGLGNIWGSLIAAAALTVLPEMLRAFSDYRMLVYAIVLILVMLATNNPTFKVFFSRFRRGGSRKSTGKEAM